MKKKKDNHSNSDKKSCMEKWEEQFNNYIDEDYRPGYHEIMETEKCPCGGDIWQIDGVLICGHCNRKWYPRE